MYTANAARYDAMRYNRCGRSGVLLPSVSLGWWHNFGELANYANAKAMALGAFDLGITHFDLANNYGPPPGEAERTLGRLLREELGAYRDELILSTKAGYRMWPGPYGDFGSKKYLVASLDQSLARMGLDYVDIFYHHRPDADTPLEETMDALAGIVRSGKALYIGLSNYRLEQTRAACGLLREMGARCLVHQPRYNLLDRWVEDGLYALLEQEGVGAVPFSPLAQGLLTDRYFAGIPADSRAGGPSVFLKPDSVTPAAVDKARALDRVARARGQTLAQMALAWLLRTPVTASVIIGASRLAQIEECVQATRNADFTAEELAAIDAALAGN